VCYHEKTKRPYFGSSHHIGTCVNLFTMTLDTSKYIQNDQMSISQSIQDCLQKRKQIWSVVLLPKLLFSCQKQVGGVFLIFIFFSVLIPVHASMRTHWEAITLPETLRACKKVQSMFICNPPSFYLFVFYFYSTFPFLWLYTSLHLTSVVLIHTWILFIWSLLLKLSMRDIWRHLSLFLYTLTWEVGHCFAWRVRVNLGFYFNFKIEELVHSELTSGT
jgi:hypothetical protein